MYPSASQRTATMVFEPEASFFTFFSQVMLFDAIPGYIILFLSVQAVCRLPLSS
jgi:hypothetical protein